MEPHAERNDDRVSILHDTIQDLSAKNDNLSRENDTLNKKLYDSRLLITQLKKEAKLTHQPAQQQEFADDGAEEALAETSAALDAALARTVLLEKELREHQIITKSALVEVNDAQSSVAAVEIMNRQLTLALEDTKGQRNNALRRAHKAEAALAELRASTVAVPKSVGSSGLSTPLTNRLAGTGLPTPDTARPVASANAEHRELMSRFDALLNEHRGLKRKHSELQDKWDHFKANVIGQLSPHKPRPAFRRPTSPDLPTGPLSPPRTATQYQPSSSPTLPSSPAPARETRQLTSPTKVVARTNISGPAPPTPKSHNSQEVIATSDTEEEDWDPSKQPTPDADDDEPPTAAEPSPSPSSSPGPSTPRRSRTHVGSFSRRRAIEEVLVPDSSPERAALEPESQTQETQPSIRSFSAPPESPTRSPARTQPSSARRPMALSPMRVLKRKASQELDDLPQRKEPRVMAPPLTISRLAGPRILDIQFTDRRKNKAGPSTDKTLNSMFEINKDANHGLDYQFDEVVRTKDERRQLHGGDCECCRDYYTSVGPLPPRQQRPRWRSESQESQPTFTWSKSTVGGMTKAEAETAAAIAAHRNDISRHRHQWAPTSTPPDYWDIGFPDTQQVQSINEKAAIMHAQKMNHIVVEASKPNGKYKRKPRP